MNSIEPIAGDHEPEPSAGNNEPAKLGQGRLILIVEDNEKNARLIVAMLEAAGFHTCLADDGNAGLATALNCAPDLIITDLQMPGMDGVTMAHALRTQPVTSTIPILAISAHALNDHREQALAAGCCGFLTKPFRFRELLAEVATALAPALGIATFTEN